MTKSNEEKILAMLEKQEAILESHSAMLEKQGAILESHSAMLQSHGETLQSHSVMLQSHSSMLETLVVKVNNLEDAQTALEDGQNKLIKDMAIVKKDVKQLSTYVKYAFEDIQQLDVRTQSMRVAK